MSLCTVGPASRGGQRAPDPLLQFLPNGLTLFADTSFNTPWNGTTAVDGWYIANQVSGISRETDTSGGHGPWVTRFDFPEGSLGGRLQPNPPSWAGSGGSGAGTLWTQLGNTLNYRHVYWAARHFFSANYIAHTNRSGGEKFWYPTWSGVTLGQAPWICFVGQPDTALPPFAFVAIDWTPYPAFTPTVLLTDYVIPAGEWVDIAIEYIIGDPLTPNTTIRIWVNGVQVCNRTDFNAYRGDPGIRISAVRYDTTRGGGEATIPVPAGGMFRKLDRMVLYGSTT